MRIVVPSAVALRRGDMDARRISWRTLIWLGMIGPAKVDTEGLRFVLQEIRTFLFLSV